MPISGSIGPRGDGYRPDRHDERRGGGALPRRRRSRTFADTAADMVTAITMNYAEEAIGIARAAADGGMPVVISFTRRDRRPAADRPGARRGDRRGRRRHRRGARLLHDQLRPPDAFRARARQPASRGSTRSAASAPTPRRRSHAELDAAHRARRRRSASSSAGSYAALRRRLGRLTVLGGCCGTDHRHIEQICLACTEAA